MDGCQTMLLASTAGAERMEEVGGDASRDGRDGAMAMQARDERRPLMVEMMCET